VSKFLGQVQGAPWMVLGAESLGVVDKRPEIGIFVSCGTSRPRATAAALCTRPALGACTGSDGQ